MGVVHAGWFVDPAAHRHRRFLLVQLALTLVAGEAFAQQPAAALEHRHRLDPGEAQQSVRQPTKAFPAGVVESFGGVGDGVDMTGRHHPIGQGVLEAGHLLAHLGTIRHRLRLPRRASAVAGQHLRRRLRAALGRELFERRAIATSTASTQPRTRCANFTTPVRPARSQTATSTANSSAIASPTPRSFITQPLSTTTINQGEAGCEPP